MNRLLEIIGELNQEDKIVKGKEVNPKNIDAKLYGPFAVQTYANGNLNYSNNLLEIKKSEIQSAPVKDISEYKIEVIKDFDIIESKIRVSKELFPQIGLKQIKTYTKDNEVICVSKIEKEQVKFIYFPREDSNVGIYCNNQNITSYVTDGKVQIINGKVYNGSANERAVMAYINQFETLKEYEYPKKLNKLLSDELWQLEDEDNKKEETPKVKSLNILGYTQYLNFPQMDDGTPYNVIWLDDGTPLGEICKKQSNLKEYIRFSSLSQNGICASAGRLGKKTEYGYEILPVKQFKGTKGKLDISATQGPKTYKQSNYQGRTLVVLAEIKPNGHKYAMNLMGNCITTKEAFDNYKSDLTRDKALEHKTNYPAHKVFIKTAGEIVRIKGATSFMDMEATLSDNTTTKNILILPPREFNPDGSIDTDIDKFKYLCATKDNESKLQLVKLKVEGIDEEIEAPALWCDIYEDAAHSSVYSLRLKEQNIFYYGAIYTMYRNNGWVKTARALTDMLDQEKLNIAMNFVSQQKSELIEISEDEIFEL